MKERIIELRKELDNASHYYHQGKDLVMEDKEYDEKYRELLKLEEENPSMFDGNSITQRVGHIPLKEFKKVTRTEQMASLDNAFNHEELNKYTSKNGLNGVMLLEQPKIDGLAIEIKYVNGEYTQASTRGDGYVGEDVTKQVKTIRNVPLRLSRKIDITVRGEVVLPKDAFMVANEMRIRNGKEPYANPRNAASGALRNLDPKETSKVGLAFIAHGAAEKYDGKLSAPRNTELQLVLLMQDLGFEVPKYNTLTAPVTEEHLKNREEIKDSYRYWTDGIVFKVNEFILQEKLGSNNRFPNWAIAYKFDTEKANTKVLDITLQVGRTGAITPVFELEPVFIAGTVVKRATASNFGVLSEKDIRINDIVELHKSGEIIPEVIRVVVRSEDGERVTMPELCPSCGNKLDTSEAIIRCTYDLCPAQLSRQVEHYTSRDAMNIKGIGPVLADNLVKSGLIKYPIDMFGLTEKEWCSLPRVGVKTAQKIMANLETAKNQPVDRLVYSLGGRLVGRTTSKLLATEFGSFENVLKASPKEMSKIHGIGDEISSKAYQLFNSKGVEYTVSKMTEYGILSEEVEEVVVEKNANWTGKTVVITGTSSNWKRKELQEILEGFGAKVTGSVSGKTDILIAGEKAGSKLDKAISLGIEVLNEEQTKERL